MIKAIFHSYALPIKGNLSQFYNPKIELGVSRGIIFTDQLFMPYLKSALVKQKRTLVKLKPLKVKNMNRLLMVNKNIWSVRMKHVV